MKSHCDASDSCEISVKVFGEDAATQVFVVSNRCIRTRRGERLERKSKQRKQSVLDQITATKDLSILVIKEREYKSLYDWCQLVVSSGKNATLQVNKGGRESTSKAR